MKTLKRLRQEVFLTQAGLAAACGVSKQSIWEWEHGYSRPGPENLRKLVEVLGKPVSEILDALDLAEQQRKEKERERPAA